MPDNFEKATELNIKAQEFMLQFEISPTPKNFSVIYLYLSDKSKALNHKINLFIEDNKELDCACLSELFDEFLSNNQQIDSEILLPFESSLAVTLSRLDTQVDNENDVLVNLEKTETALSKLTQYKPLHNIITFLINSITNSKSQRKVLSNELNQTSNEVKRLREKLDEARRDAIIDSLTGLLNRRGFDEKLQHLDIEEVHSSLVIDIDFFKKVNDNFGHFIGDNVIKRVAKIINQAVSTQDLTARYGGEEFMIVLKNQSQDAAYKIGETIRTNIANLKLKQRQTNTYLPSITVSIGIAEVNHDNNWSELFERADQALYQAKNTGRNRCISA